VANSYTERTMKYFFKQNSRDVHGIGVPNGTENPMGTGIKHRIGNGNGKPPQWEWELPALP